MLDMLGKKFMKAVKEFMELSKSVLSPLPRQPTVRQREQGVGLPDLQFPFCIGGSEPTQNRG